MDLAISVYRAAAALPAIERFALAAQLRRAATSIPSNVAEGHAGGIRKQYRHHVRLALGSLAEMSTQLELAARLGYLDETEVIAIQDELARTGQLLHGVLRSINRQLRAGLQSKPSY